MYVDPFIAVLVPLFSAALGFTFAALLGASAHDRRQREAAARQRHPAGKQLKLRSVPIEWRDAL